MQLSVDEALALACSYMEKDNLYQAATLCQSILTYEPNCSEALHVLSRIALKAFNYTAAIDLCLKAIDVSQNSSELYNTLGIAQHKIGNVECSIKSFSKAISLDGNNIHALHNLACAECEFKNHSKAMFYFRKALEKSPNSKSIFIDYTDMLRKIGEVELLEKEYSDAAQKSFKGNDWLLVRRATLLPAIILDDSHILKIRTHLVNEINSLNGNISLDENVAKDVGHTTFFTAYHGLCDAKLNKLIASLYLNSCEAISYFNLSLSQSKSAPNKIGFISRFFYNHSIGKTSRGLIANLNRDEFEVVTIHVDIGIKSDQLRQWIDEHSDTVVTLPSNLIEAQEMLSSLDLDILYFQDIGMDPYTYFLAFGRYAPIQCVASGHPVTTGIPNIDYYISSNFFEPENGDSHYTERLIRLNAPHWYYYRPAKPEGDFLLKNWGVPDSCFVYVCPQTLFKVHPQFDNIIETILTENSDAVVVFIDSPQSEWKMRLLERWTKRMPKLIKNIYFVPPLSENDFRGLLSLSDIVLDTVFFGGYNTTLEALSLGKPIITLQTEFQRGRHASGLLREIGMEDLITYTLDQYTDLALCLSKDSKELNRIRHVILSRVDKLFEDKRVISEHERCFKELIQSPKDDY